MVRSSVNYLGSMDEKPVFYAQNIEQDNLVLEPHDIEIHDARELRQPPSLEIHGFTLVQHETRVRDFAHDRNAEQTYRREIEELVLELTGADRVFVGKTVLRWSERAGDTSEFVNSRPARFVHVDYSRQSFDEFARFYTQDEEDAANLLAGRYVAYNIWRVTNPPPHDAPLAVCDARTTAPEDVTTGEAVIDAPGQPEFRFGSSLYHFSPAHRWYYFRDMRCDEALVFKAFDSDTGRVQGCPHSAFDDPTSPPDCPPRGSAEIRAYAFFRDG